MSGEGTSVETELDRDIGILGAIPETVGREAEGRVIMAKRDLGVVSRLRRWLRWG